VEGSVVFTWGQGEDGQLGLGDNEQRLLPCAVDLSEAIGTTTAREGAATEGNAESAMREVACGAEHTLVILSSDGGPLACSWGECVHDYPSRVTGFLRLAFLLFVGATLLLLIDRVLR
jgi:alpha-tubulin suppressor-like RCC1 family protein